MKQTPRVKTIMALLAETDRSALIECHREHGLFSIHAISIAVFDCDAHQIKPHQLSSLYRTLRALLNEGVIVARKEVEGQYGDKLPVARRYYHLADKVNYDMGVIAEYERTKPTTGELLKKMFG
jgi:DNA-binding transcriptional ArsR family regulator